MVIKVILFLTVLDWCFFANHSCGLKLNIFFLGLINNFLPSCPYKFYKGPSNYYCHFYFVMSQIVAVDKAHCQAKLINSSMTAMIWRVIILIIGHLRHTVVCHAAWATWGTQHSSVYFTGAKKILLLCICSSTLPEQKHANFSLQNSSEQGTSRSEFELNLSSCSRDMHLKSLSYFLQHFLKSL